MSELNAEIRPVALSDADDLYANCFSRSTPAKVVNRVKANIAMHEAGEGIQLVAVVDGVVVGSAMLKRNTHPLYRHRAEWLDVVVHGDFRRQGIARRMIAAGRQHALDLGIEIVETSCRAGTPAEQAYARMGFLEYGRLDRGIVEPDGSAFDEVFYRTPLVDAGPADRRRAALEIAQRLSNEMDEAWNAHDADAMAAMFTDEGTFTFHTGLHIRGKARIGRVWRDRIFPQTPDSLRHLGKVTSARWVSDDVLTGTLDFCIYDAEMVEDPDDIPEEAMHLHTRALSVLVRQGWQWRVSLIQLWVPDK